MLLFIGALREPWRSKLEQRVSALFRLLLNQGELLSGTQHEAVLLTQCVGLSNLAASAALHCSESNVQKLLLRARTRLNAALILDGLGDLCPDGLERHSILWGEYLTAQGMLVGLRAAQEDERRRLALVAVVIVDPLLSNEGVLAAAG